MAGELQNTMTTTSPDAQMQALLAALAQQVQGAQGQAQQAGAQYEQAAAEPVPQVGGLAAFLPQLLSNTASTISGNPNYAKQGQQGLQQANENLLEKRKTNLQSLRDRYSTLAEHAGKLGNVEAEAQWRSKAAGADREHDKIMQAAKDTSAKDQLGLEHKNRIALERERGSQDRKTNAAKPSAAAMTPDDLSVIAENLANGTAKLENFPIKQRADVLAFMKSNKMKIIPQTVRKAIDELSGAERTIDELEVLSSEVNTAGPGLGRFATGAKRAVGAFTQKDMPATSFANTRGGLAGNLARAVGSERGVLTDQDRAWAMKLIPAFNDAAPVAQDKIARLRRFIQGKREAAVRNYSTDDATKKASGPANPMIESRRLVKAGDFAGLDALIAENPELDDDPALERLVRGAKK